MGEGSKNWLLICYIYTLLICYGYYAHVGRFLLPKFTIIIEHELTTHNRNLLIRSNSQHVILVEFETGFHFKAL